MFEVLYNLAINWPSQTGLAVTLGVATLLVIAGLVLTFRKWIGVGRGLGLFGFLVIMVALLALREQTVVEKPSESITITRYRCSERTRLLLLSTLSGLPCAALATMWLGLRSTRSRLIDQVPRHLKAGRQYFAQKDYEAALKEYNQAIHTAPHLAEAYCRRGSVYQAMGKTAQAATDFDEAITRDPRLAAAYLERGKLRTECGDYDGALADFGQLMVIRANDPGTYLHRGICLVKKGLLSDAQADFNRVLKLTNHTDFAEPAKEFLRQLADPAASSLSTSTNGETSLPRLPQARPQDHAI